MGKKSEVPGWALYIITEWRAAIIVLFVMPMSFLARQYNCVCNWIHERFLADATGHEGRVTRVQEEVRRWNELPAAGRKMLCTDRNPSASHSVRFAPKHLWHKIKMGDLRSILSLDEKEGIVRVEPGVTMGHAMRYLSSKGLMLTVTLEMEDATIGGLVMATGMTFQSHRNGLVHDSVTAYELIMPDGSFVRVDRQSCGSGTEHGDLFQALPWSHGTIGLLVALELRVVPAVKYVKVKYTPFKTQAGYVKGMQEALLSKTPCDTLEMIVFSKQTAVMMQGTFVGLDGDGVSAAELSSKMNNISAWYKEWYFKHVESYLSSSSSSSSSSPEETYQEIIPLQTYLMRHDRSIYWIIETLIGGSWGNHWLFRYTLGWMYPPSVALMKASHSAVTRELSIRKQVFQDIGFPQGELQQAVNKSAELFDIWPLLVFPCKVTRHETGGFVKIPDCGRFVDSPDDATGRGRTDASMFLNVGIYGVPRPLREKKAFKTVTMVRALEKFARDIGGFQHTYCDSFLTRKEFEEQFDVELLNKVRANYGSDKAFPDVFEKTRPEMDVFEWLAEEEQMETDTSA